MKQIRYTVENTIIIKHSLTVTKFPVYSQNPLITYDLNATSKRKEFYAFAVFRYGLAPNILTLNIMSVDFNVNILTTFSDGFKALQKNVVARDISDFQLWLSISDSVVSSTSHAVNFSDESEYENLTIHMKDLVIKSGDFIFKNKRDRCEPSEHIKEIIEMHNVTICNTGNVTLSVHGCFNMSIEKLTCSDFTWKKQEMFTFTGGVLYTKNVLIKNILANNNIKYNISETKPLFLIKESVPEIQNTLIEECVEMSRIRAKRFSTVIIIQNSVVQILDTKMVRNSFQNFALANKSSLRFKNMTLIKNHVSATLCRAEESSVTLHEIKFHRNNIRCLVSINLNSKVLITGNSLTENRIFKNAYSVSRSLMKIDNTNYRGNLITNLMLAKSRSHIYIDNVTFNNNHVIKAFISRQSKLKMYNAEFMQNKFYFVLLLTSSHSIIQKSTLTGNSFFLLVCDIKKSSIIQLNHVAFIRNKLRYKLCWIRSNSRAIIQNNTLIENNFSSTVYDIKRSSTIQLNYVAFTRNNLVHNLLRTWPNSSAIIQDNTLIDNTFSRTVYHIDKSSTIQLNHVDFIRNKLKNWLLSIESNSRAIIQNNTLIKNSFSWTAYDIKESSTINLTNVAFIQNSLLGNLLNMVSNCSAKLVNNRMVENSLERMFLAQSSYLGIDRIFIMNNTLSELIKAVECKVSFESMKIQENNVRYLMIYVKSSTGNMTNTYNDNSGSSFTGT